MDLNSDMGESFGAWKMGDDAAMLQIVTSANIACGFHAGDPFGMLKVLYGAAVCGVSVGAHVGYRDLAGFGRRAIAVAPDELTAEVIYQLGALDGLARAARTRVSYVKPHGALYNTIAEGGAQADAVIAAIRAYDPELPVLALAGAPFVAQARDAGLVVVGEAFADRGYLPDGRLMPRGRSGSVLHDADDIAARMLRFARDGVILDCDGGELRLDAASICVHGDGPGAVAIARRISDVFKAEGIALSPFAGG
ncbi:LamB/YcsF family protein [Paracoccus aurantiacus]|uniref:LamB/YcsF family protein n=1 Tax=Paracoccus aurantiacus TaxID=2599412 RepID=UPI0036394F4D